MGILRTILALAVVVFHSYKIFGLRMCGGQIAVELFYMISGFYMALILNEKYVGLKNYKKFIYSRFLRIFPVYWFVLVLVFFVCLISYFGFNNPLYLSRYINNYNGLSLQTISYFIFENIAVIGQDVLYFMRIDENYQPHLTYNVLSYKHTGYQYLLVPQAWTISLEFMFYLIAPFLVTKKIKWQIGLVLLGISVKVIFSKIYYLSFDPWTYRFFPFEFAYFMSGSISYFLFKKIEFASIRKIYGLILLICLCLCVFLFDEIPVNDSMKKTSLLFFCFTSMPFIFLSFKDSKIDRSIGDYSFSLYIGHHLIVCVLRPYFFANTHLLYYYGYAVVLCSILFALFLQKLVIEKVENYRFKIF
jgi:peptidoglycan/LPS O-acetylase OafA/YrhL